MAKQIGLDLTRIPGSGNGGRITIEDVRTYIHALQSGAFSQAPVLQAQPVIQEKPSKPSIDFSKWGSVRKEPFSSLRQKIAENLTTTWNEVPHVTQFEEADLTSVMALRKKYNPKYEKKNAKLTVTVFVMKALVEALKQYESFNASYDDNTKELVLKEYFHLGVAVDTDSGLVVPVIRDVDKKSMKDLAIELNEMAEKARNRKLGIEDMRGGCCTISNLGSLGVGQFTPIVNAPEVAILGIGRGYEKPIMKDKKLHSYLTMPLALSYDHRVIDGADGARFIVAFKKALESFDESLLKELK